MCSFCDLVHIEHRLILENLWIDTYVDEIILDRLYKQFRLYTLIRTDDFTCKRYCAVRVDNVKCPGRILGRGRDPKNIRIFLISDSTVINVNCRDYCAKG